MAKSVAEKYPETGKFTQTPLREVYFPRKGQELPNFLTKKSIPRHTIVKRLKTKEKRIF